MRGPLTWGPLRIPMNQQRLLAWARQAAADVAVHTANLRTKVLDIRGFDSSRVLVLRGGILMSIGNFLDKSFQV